MTSDSFRGDGSHIIKKPENMLCFIRTYFCVTYMMIIYFKRSHGDESDEESGYVPYVPLKERRKAQVDKI